MNVGVLQSNADCSLESGVHKLFNDYLLAKKEPLIKRLTTSGSWTHFDISEDSSLGSYKERNGYETFQIRDVLVAVDLDESVLNTYNSSTV